MKNTTTKMWRDENTHIWKNYNLFVVTSFEKIILHMWNDELFDVEVKKLQFFFGWMKLWRGDNLGIYERSFVRCVEWKLKNSCQP